MKTITFYSYKGGVGRSLALANLAQRLVEFGKSVCMLDFDLEAPGLPFKFDANKILAMNKKGVVDFVTEYNVSGVEPATLGNDYMIRINTDNKSQKPLHLITAGNSDKPAYWKNLMAIDWKQMFYSESGQGYRLMIYLKALIENEIKPDYILIDSRTGVTESSGIALSILADRVVIIAANNDENIYGSKMIIRALADDKNINRNLPVHFVLSRVPFTKEPNERLKEKDRVDALMAEFIKQGLEVRGNINLLHSDRELEEKEKLKILEFNKGEAIDIGDDYRRLFKQLFESDFNDDEKLKFERQEKAYGKYAEFKNAKDDSQRLEIINECIELAPSADYYFQRARLNDARKFVVEAKGDYEKAIELDPENYIYYFYYSLLLLYDLNSPNNSIIIVNQALELLPQKAILYLVRAFCWRELNNPELQEKDLLNAIYFEPSDNYFRNFISEFYFINKRYSEAYTSVYKALEVNQDETEALLILAKLQYIDSELDGFYQNLDRALAKDNSLIVKDEFFRPLINDPRFQRILYKYNITMKLPEVPPEEEAKA